MNGERGGRKSGVEVSGPAVFQGEGSQAARHELCVFRKQLSEATASPWIGIPYFFSLFPSSSCAVRQH